ncbi:MAG: hypothetical protein QXL89_08790 [Nitrososphaeria archaeon]
MPFTKEMLQEKGFKEIQKLNPKWISDPGCLYNLPPDAEKTIIAKCEISERSIEKVSFLPVYMDRKTAMPEILKSNDDRFWEVVKYMEEITRSQDLDRKFMVVGDKVVLI